MNKLNKQTVNKTKQTTNLLILKTKRIQTLKFLIKSKNCKLSKLLKNPEGFDHKVVKQIINDVDYFKFQLHKEESINLI